VKRRPDRPPVPELISSFEFGVVFQIPTLPLASILKRSLEAPYPPVRIVNELDPPDAIFESVVIFTPLEP